MKYFDIIMVLQVLTVTAVVLTGIYIDRLKEENIYLRSSIYSCESKLKELTPVLKGKEYARRF